MNLRRHYVTAGIVLVAGSSGLLAGRWLNDVRTTEATARRNAPLTIGAQLPDAIVHTLASESLKLSTAISAHNAETVLLAIFAPGCASCIGDVLEWEKIHVTRTQLPVIALAVGPDKEFVREIRRKTSATFPIYLIDSISAKKLRALAPPVVYVVTSGGNVKFAASGGDATLRLKRSMGLDVAGDWRLGKLPSYPVLQAV